MKGQKHGKILIGLLAMVSSIILNLYAAPIEEVHSNRLLPDLRTEYDFALKIRKWANAIYVLSDRTGVQHTTTLGDIMGIVRRDVNEAKTRVEALPDKELRTWLTEVIHDGVHAPRWKPNARNHLGDGFHYFGQHQEGPLLVHQMSILIWAPASHINARDRIFSLYPRHVGSDCIKAQELENERRTTRDGITHRNSYQVDFLSNLPWPYADLRFVCGYVDIFSPDGSITCNFFDVGRKFTGYKRFNVFVGRDALIPFRDTHGSIVATAVVTAFAMDIAGVPDGDGACIKLMQEGLGNMKRKAEDQQ